MTDQIDQKTKVYDILKGFSTAMLVTHGLSGRHGARPMHVAQLDQDASEMRFFTGHGGLSEEIQKEAAVLLVFQNDHSAYVSVRGRARIEQDRAKVKELWKEPYKVWFPKGPDDPEITLVAVDLLDAEYWDNRGMNKLEYLFQAAKAYVKGQKPEVIDADQHAKATL
jgi:general stress protein 26